jgi:TatD DNase family protein
MELFDTHAHLNAGQFEAILPDVIQRANDAGVTKVTVVGCTAEDSQTAIDIAEQYVGVFASVGIQPNYVSEANEGDYEKIVELAMHPSVIAIGETGLDRYWDRAPFELQQEYFAKHIQLSISTGKPFIVHMRECGDDILDSLKPFTGQAPLKGIMHSFTGDAELAVKCMEFGLHISFAGMLTYKKSDDLRSVAATIPLDRLLVETDCPYLSPHPKRDQRPNEPALVRLTAECLAEQKKVSLEEIAQITTANACKLFGLS